MEILKNSGRQYPLSADKTIKYTDGLTAAQAAAVQDVFDVPVGTRVTGGEIVVEEVWDSGTSAVVDIGDTVDPDRYTSSPVDLTSLGLTALTLTGYKTTGVGDRTIDGEFTLVGSDATQGQAYIRVEYVVDNKAHETVGFAVADYGSKNAPETP